MQVEVCLCVMWLARSGWAGDQSLLIQDLPSTPRQMDLNDTRGDLDNALSTMLYHRSMMNEYLCHNYLADEILTDLTPLESRSDSHKTPVTGLTSDSHDHGQAELLGDPGSSSYQHWLDRSSQLEKMYSKGIETGDVTGYATMQTSKPEGGYDYPPPSGFSPGGGSDWLGAASGGGNDGGSKGWQDNVADVTDWGWEEQETGKGLALKELFNLALTAMAFLAFGVFVLNLIMTCFAKTPHITLTMTSSTTSAEGRSKREVDEMRQLNELAFRVLTSVDELLALESEPELRYESGCLHYTTCDNNKYSRALDDSGRIWLPVWSLGVCWAAERLGGAGAGVGLDCVRAAVLGLGDAHCTTLYPHCTSVSVVASVGA